MMDWPTAFCYVGCSFAAAIVICKVFDVMP